MYKRFNNSFFVIQIFGQDGHILGQVTTPSSTNISNYFCSQNDDTIGFTSSSSYHAAWNPTLNCFISECYVNSTSNSSCRTSATPCFHYRSRSNGRYCAPGILCSLLEPCDNITYTCASSTSVCIVNSCCSQQTVCLSVSLTNFCPLGNYMYLIFRFSGVQ